MGCQGNSFDDGSAASVVVASGNDGGEKGTVNDAAEGWENATETPFGHS